MNPAEQRSIIQANPESLDRGERSKDMEVGSKHRVVFGGSCPFMSGLLVSAHLEEAVQLEILTFSTCGSTRAQILAVGREFAA